MKPFSVRREVASILATRETARELFAKLKAQKIYALGFKGIESVSRSFANEWLSLEKEHNYKFRKLNMSKDVSFMFEYAGKKVDSDILKQSKYRIVPLRELMSEV